MSTWHDVQFAGLQDWLRGEGPDLKETSVGGNKICLVRTASGLKAIDAKCPHAGGPFAGGFLNDEGDVVCPWHRFSFSPETGQGNSGGYFINCYEVKTTENRVQIAIPKKKWWQW